MLTSLIYEGVALEIGKGRIIRRPDGRGVNGDKNTRGKSREDRVAILSLELVFMIHSWLHRP